MVQKLVTAGVRHKKLDVLPEMFSAKLPIQDNHFVTQYQIWTEILNRGGLRFAVRDFVMLGREFDSIYRKNSDAPVIGYNKVELLSRIF